MYENDDKERTTKEKEKERVNEDEKTRARGRTGANGEEGRCFCEAAEADVGALLDRADSFGRLLASFATVTARRTPSVLSLSAVSAISSDLLTPGCIYLLPRRRRRWRRRLLRSA